MIPTLLRPYVTGRGMLADNDDTYFDGAFSRLLHPECAPRLDLPIKWDFIIHTLNPGLTSVQVRHLWDTGSQFDFGLPKPSDHLLSGSP